MVLAVATMCNLHGLNKNAVAQIFRVSHDRSPMFKSALRSGGGERGVVVGVVANRIATKVPSSS
jgi:hypothetical protein